MVTGAVLAAAAATTTTLLAPSGTPGTVTHLSSTSGNVLVVVVVALVILAGAVVAWGRWALAGKGNPSNDSTLVRSWIGVVLVGSLVLFCALAFEVDDETLRNTLIGGLVATVASVVAFYFATKSSDQARQDLLKAGASKVLVPALKGDTKAQVASKMAALPLSLVSQPPDAQDNWHVASQTPAANTTVPSGDEIKVTFAAPAAAVGP
ncbi:MAG: PASTA domain-containing protein [Acidimicrobiales bacterium]